MNLTWRDYFWMKVQVHESGCWLWTGAIMPNGYGQASRGHQHAYAHRLAYEIAVGPIPAGRHICHHCDVRACVNPLHLFAGTRADNMRDMVEKGRAARGAGHGMAKLTPDVVREIRARFAAGTPARRMAPEYGVSDSTVMRAARRELWAHVA